MSSSGPNRAIPWFIVNWITTGGAVIAFLIRIYSRALVTRSIGSDDFSLAISMLLTIAGSVINSVQVHYGLGRHQADLSSEQYIQEQKWEYVAWIVVFINYFFLRLSVLLFVLRLLPPYKKLQQRIIYVELFVNFAITLIATLTYGVACIPFKALYTDVPDAKCFSKEKLVIVSRVNAILSCGIDITTSLVPVSLLWGIQMKPSTKRVLKLIFCFGVITAAMSIGRTATSTEHNMETDTTWRGLPAKWFGMIEDNFGIIFACAPAMRQLYVYRHRTGTFLSRKDRQRPNEDFRRMRRKINIRDIFWYRQAVLKEGRVSDAHPIFKHQANSDIECLAAPERLPSDAPPVTQMSVMDWWEDKIKRVFHRTSASQSSGDSATKYEQPNLSRRLFTPQRASNPKTDVVASDQDLLKPPNQDPIFSRQQKGRLSGKYKSSGMLLSRELHDSSSATGTSTLDTHSGTELIPGHLESSLAHDSSEPEGSDRFCLDVTDVSPAHKTY